jgi:hypothetical protein
MAWKWDTFKEWVPESGTAVKVVVAAGLLASGGLLWWERAQPRYPTARDEAEIIGAFVERYGLAQRRARLSYGYVKYHRYPVLSGSTWTNELQLNAVGLYPDRSFYLVTVTNTLRVMESSATNISLTSPRWVDLATGSGTPGSYRLQGRAWNGVQHGWWDATPFKTNEIMDHTWWRSNIWATAPHHGALPYVTNRPFYMGTNMLNQIGRALTAYRWTWELGSDPTNEMPYFTHATVAEGLASNHDDADSAIDAACDAVVWTQPGFTSNDLAHLELASHYALGTAYESDGKWNAHVWEKVATRIIIDGFFTDYARYVSPLITGMVSRAAEHGVITGLYADAMPDGDRYLLAGGSDYYHNRGFDTNKWEMVTLSAEEIDGHTTEGYRSFIRAWDGMFDKGEMKARLNATGHGIMGWASGPAIFVIDWRFQCLTNRAAFWD